MVMFRRTLLLTWVVLVSVAACTPASPASTYPTRPITLIVPFPPGGLTDQVARPLVEAVKSYLPQPVVITNQPGVAGTIGTAEVIRARPDGYIIGITVASTLTIQPHVTDTPYRGPETYRPIAQVVRSPPALAVRTESPWATVSEVLAEAWWSPGKVRVGHPGLFTIHHLAIKMLKGKSGAELIQVPFGGGGESSAALLGGHIEAVVIPPSVIQGHVQAGKLRLLALFESDRVATMAEVPTFKELGYDIVVSESVVMFGPKELPEDVVQILATAFNAAAKTESFKKFAADNQPIIDCQD